MQRHVHRLLLTFNSFKFAKIVVNIVLFPQMVGAAAVVFEILVAQIAENSSFRMLSLRVDRGKEVENESGLEEAGKKTTLGRKEWRKEWRKEKKGGKNKEERWYSQTPL